MSATKYIACTDCRKYLWIGQGSIIYTGESDVMEALRKFLIFDHNSSSGGAPHNLIMVDDCELVDGLLAGFECVSPSKPLYTSALP